MRMGKRQRPATGMSPKTLPEIMHAYERIVIIKALQLNEFCRLKTAESLGVSRDYLYGRIRLLGIDLSQLPGRVGRPKLERVENG